jgi:hypothetical protein
MLAVANPAGEDDEDEVMDEGYNDTFNPYKPGPDKKKYNSGTSRSLPVQLLTDSLQLILELLLCAKKFWGANGCDKPSQNLDAVQLCRVPPYTVLFHEPYQYHHDRKT